MKNNKGFSILELVIGLSVLALGLYSAALFIPSISASRTGTEGMQRDAELKRTLASQIDCAGTYELHGIDPTTLATHCSYSRSPETIEPADRLTLKKCVKEAVSRRCDPSSTVLLGNGSDANGAVDLGVATVRAYCSASEGGILVDVLRQDKHGESHWEALLGHSTLPF